MRLILGIIVALIFSLTELPKVLAFDYFEHRYLGNISYDRARNNLCKSNPNFVKVLDGIVTSKFNFPQREWKNDKCDNSDSEIRINDYQQNPSLPKLGIYGNMVNSFLRHIPAQFGDMPALAGDHTEDPSGLTYLLGAFAKPHERQKEYPRIIATRRQWFNVCRWLYDESNIESGTITRRRSLPYVASCLKDYAPAFKIPGDFKFSSPNNNFPDDIPIASPGYSPSRMELSAFERLEGYVGLAKNNESHFPMHSWKMFIDNHELALRFAGAYLVGQTQDEDILQVCGVRNSDTVKQDCLLHQALIHEGFAQHFLHDSFSSGHIGSDYTECRLLIFCSPPKHLVQHTHDSLNRLGLQVIIPNLHATLFSKPNNSSLGSTYVSEIDKLGELIEQGWTAFGDDHLFIPEAAIHREIILRVATLAILEVFQKAASGKSDTDSFEVCHRWVKLFPIPMEEQQNLDPICGLPGTASTLVKNKAATSSIFPQDFADFIFGRSSNKLVDELPLEGWKVLATWGMIFGQLDALNQDGSVRKTRNSIDGGSIEVGYVRPTNWWVPNFVGFGSFIVPSISTSLYGSFGYWLSPPSRLFWGGLRLNIGPRIEEPFTQANDKARRQSQFEFGLPLDVGLEIYPPVSLYIRTGLASLVIRNLGDPDPNQVKIESLFVNGIGSVTIGLRFDLAGVRGLF